MALPPGPALPPVLQTLMFMWRPAEVLDRLAARYGDVYTQRHAFFGAEVTISDPTLIKQVFTGDADTFHAGEANTALGAILGDRSLLLLDGAEHLRQRKLMMPPFHGERMHSYSEAMIRITEQTLEGLREGEEISLHPSMQRIALDTILSAVFGMADSPRHVELRERLAALMKQVRSRVGILLLINELQRDLGPLTPWSRFQRDMARVNELLYGEITQRRAELAEPSNARGTDVLSMLLEARDEQGDGMTDGELRDELMTLVVGGHETTATALCWAFEKILSHPEVLGRLVAEVDGAAPSGPIGPEQLGRLEYLDATIKETLRLRPVFPEVGRMLKKPMTIRGYEIPAETLIAPSAYNTHRRPDLYPDPTAFRPERFLGKKPDPYAWLPFGGGVRRCLGMAFALFEMKIVLATMLRRVRLTLVKPAPLRVVLRSFLFSPEGGTRVKVLGTRSEPPWQSSCR